MDNHCFWLVNHLETIRHGRLSIAMLSNQNVYIYIYCIFIIHYLYYIYGTWLYIRVGFHFGVSIFKMSRMSRSWRTSSGTYMYLQLHSFNSWGRSASLWQDYYDICVKHGFAAWHGTELTLARLGQMDWGIRLKFIWVEALGSLGKTNDGYSE